MSIYYAIGLAAVAGLATSVGGLIGQFVHLGRGEKQNNVRAGTVALGGGILLAAVTFVLVPASAVVGLPAQAALIAVGAITFLAIDAAIQRRGGAVSQLLAATMDSAPESLGLGAALALGGTIGPLLVLLLALQNLPEGFNSFRELRAMKITPLNSQGILLAAALLEPIAAAIGYLTLAGHPLVVASLFAFSAGGVLYLVFHDIAPMAHRDGHWVPTLGSIAGFIIGLVSKVLVGGS